MENIAIITGGESEEHEISLLSAQSVLENLNKNLFKGYIVHLRNNNFYVKVSKKEIKINKEKFTFEYNKKQIFFSKVFLAIHGNPAEDGEIQHYFDKLNITYNCCNSEISKLTFNKYLCNKRLRKLGFHCANSYLYNIDEGGSIKDIVEKINTPFFVKPNNSGSSFGITKVSNIKNIEAAINNAGIYDKDVIIEDFIKGKEISCGVFKNNKDIIQALPITEIKTENEFFDYSAKYEGKSEEITPAQIDKKLTNKIQDISVRIYKDMQLNGICRVDYIIKNETPFVLEINTIPGFSKESIIPKQLKEANIQLSEVITICLKNVNN